MLVIGAYRDNEVTDGHPLEDMINDIKNTADDFCVVNRMYLGPLQEQAMGELIADTLRYNCADVFELTRFLYQKSKGNPFFVKELLVTLYQRGVFTFNEDAGNWCWNLDEIKDIGISDNVAEFLIQTISLLPADSFEILKTASCIENDFCLRLLYHVKNEVNQIPEAIFEAIFDAISKALWAALEMELIIPLDNNYRMLACASDIPRDEFLTSSMEIKFRFSHDRIKDAGGLYHVSNTAVYLEMEKDFRGRKD